MSPRPSHFRRKRRVLTWLQFVLALIWDLAEFITRFVRKFKAGIHPGAHVALTLILWLAAGVAGGLEGALLGMEYRNDCYDFDTDELVSCWGGKRGQMIGVTVVTCLVWLIQFILFIGACIDTAKHNAFAKRPIMVVNPPYWGPMAQGWQQMPQNYGPQQGQYMAVPQQGFPLQTRSPSPSPRMTTEEGTGKEPMRRLRQPQGHSGVTEFYTPGTAS